MTLVVDNSQPAAAPRTVYRRRRSTFRRRRPYGRTYKTRRYGRTRRFSRRRMINYAVALHRMPKFLRAQINPFDANVSGVKIPDSNTYPSGTIKVEDTWGFTSDANGLVCKAFFPTVTNTIVSHVANTSTSWTWQGAYAGGTDSTRKASIVANCQLIRPCAHGLKFMCTGAPTAVTGSVHVAVVAHNVFGKATWNLPTSITDLSNAMFYKRYPLAQFTQQSLTVVNKFLDCTSQRYFDPSSDVVDNATDVTLHTSGWACVLICIEGAPANTTIAGVEEVLHIETIPIKGGIESVSPAAAFNVDTQQTVSHMAGNTPASYAEQEEQSYLQEVAAAIGNGARTGLSNAISNYFAPAAGHLAYAGVSYAARRAFGIPGVTNYRNPSAFETLM